MNAADTMDEAMRNLHQPRLKISVITPTQLAVNPNSFEKNLWLDLAFGSVQRQTVREDHDFEFVVGLSRGEGSWSAMMPSRFEGVTVAIADKLGQAAAVNAAVAASSGDILAFLEDDDTWEPLKLLRQLPQLKHFQFISCNQREMADDRATWVRTNDFPTPSGWLMRRELWDAVGGFDESFRFHLDTQFLGRLNAANVKRVHLVERGAAWRPWLNNVAKHSLIMATEDFGPLVVRVANPKGGMAKIATDPAALAISRDEHGRMLDQFGEVPW